ncbi:pectin lyase-like protein [Mollisia scopiformis]|uniref:Pectin lyase-like protein n=1 Tax=Mollisia scopiformis TaxID=149040 RepID=A0A194X1F3_MOLSC|nr:pectin lyase-like protein [Mollisia scopiformis]KUJ14026.1 pectin lyase-like protein [Mollisia scopiformis]
MTGPITGPLSYAALDQIHHNSTVQERQAGGDGYWLSTLGSLGEMPLAPSGYQFFRNVKLFGAVGDGVTDDTAAINRAASAFSSTNLTIGRCGANCGSSTTLGAVVYFPPGTYLISTPIVQYYYTQFVGNAYNIPTIKGSFNFTGIALFDSDFYIPGGNSAEWYINQSNFYRQIRNFNFDMTGMNWTNTDNDQTYFPTGIHWQVGQATSITNCNFNMAVSSGSQSATAMGIAMENGSGGMVSDLTFTGGNIGFLAGSQQFTAKNLQFTSCLTAIKQQWNWGFTWKNIYVLSCYIAIDCTSYSGITNQGTGSITVLDSHFNGVPYAITIASLGSEQPNIVLDNLLVENSASVVLISGGATILEGSSGPLYFNSWANGYQYLPDGTGGKRTGFIDPAPSKSPGLLDSSGAYFEQSKPQYPATNPIVATQNGILNDGTGDQSGPINTFLANNVGSILFFPGGIYQVQNTVKIPVGSIITGSGWSQIMGTGSFFENAASPQVMVQVGKTGDTGIIQISDMLFTVKGATAGAILMEWNVHESTQGSAAMWDSHFRVGGAAGTSLQLSECPSGATSVNKNCMAATMLMHVTSEASGYFENVWAWTADHDLDNPLNAAATESDEGIPLNVETDISIYSGRGILIESQGPTWFYGSASEHAQLYQYQLSNASNIYLGHMQTETPYYQPNPNSLSPYTIGQFPSDPTFENCADDTCRGAWALRVIESSNVFIYSAGFYSFFQNNQLGCAPEEDCQLALIDTNFVSGLWIYNIFTKGNIQIVSPQGGLPPLMFNSTTSDGYTSEIAAWLALSTGGNSTGDSGSGSNIVTIDPTLWSEPASSQTVACYPPCTYVFPPLTLTTPTTFSFPKLTTVITVGWYSSTTGLEYGDTLTQTYYETELDTTTISIPAVTTTVISWFDVTVTSNSTIIYPFPSIVPPGFNITDPTVISGVTHSPTNRTFFPPPWPGSTVPPAFTVSPTSGTPTTTTPPGGVTSVHHTRGPPSPTCTHVLGCGHSCGQGLFGFLDICSPCWLFCTGPPGLDGTDPNEPEGDPEPEPEPEPDDENTTTECQTTTFSSCNTLCTAVATTSSCSTSCKEVIGCSTTSGDSSCLAGMTSYLWTAGSGPLPTMGAGGPGLMYGFTYITGSEYTSVPPNSGTIIPTTTSSTSKTTSSKTTTSSTSTSSTPPPSPSVEVLLLSVFIETEAGGPTPELENYWEEYVNPIGSPLPNPCNTDAGNQLSQPGNDGISSYPSTFVFTSPVNGITGCTYINTAAPKRAVGTLTCPGVSVSCPTMTVSSSCAANPTVAAEGETYLVMAYCELPAS